jgi:hypothetical protein
MAGRERRERVAVAGLLIVHTRPGTRDTLRLEAWYDSLSVRRTSPEGTVEPDTDGMIGGRYRGTLTGSGRYIAEARPFIPEGVAEVADLSQALEELLPVLPPGALRQGERWRGAGVEFLRLSDSVAGDTLLRFRAQRTRTSDTVAATGDSGAIPAQQTSREEEAFVWHPGLGLLRLNRSVVVETDIPAGATVKRPVRSRVEQRISLERIR